MTLQNQLIFKGKTKLEKFLGKGGWTYIDVPKISIEVKLPFGWVIVSGQIDTFSFSNYKLMSRGNHRHFLPINASIRKKIGKKVGDEVEVEILQLVFPKSLNDELIECFKNEPRQTLQTFLELDSEEKERWLTSIYSAKTDTKKAQRIVELFEYLNP